MKTLKLFILSIAISLSAKAQLTTTQTLTPQQLVQNVLLGSGVVASNITFVGNQLQIAKFTATASTSLGIASGIFISTGNASTNSANGPQGPNNSAGTTTGFNGAGDPYLSTLSNQITKDAGILEFDFIPLGDTVRFRYVFASEEYPEFVNSINDAFALVLSGVAPTVLPQTNIAVIPVTTSTTNVVSINNINGNTNSNYYVSNATKKINTEFDGLTKVLTAKYKVNCGEPYHIKITIADGSDDQYDSGVFLEEGSFSSLPPLSLNTNNANSQVQDTLFYEDCNTYCIKFTRNQNIALKDSFLLSVSGNAINGSDYVTAIGTSTTLVNWPTKLVFNADSATYSICDIKVINDGLVENLDTLIFNITKYNPGSSTCVQANSIKFKVYLSDYKAIEISAKDSSICNGQFITLNSTATFGTPPYTYSWSPGVSNASSIVTPPITQLTNYTILINDICNHPVSKQISVIPSELPVIGNVLDYQFCLDSIKLIPFTITGGKLPNNLNWLAPTGGITPNTITNPFSVKQTITPSIGTYTVIATDQCNLTDVVTFDIKTYDCNVYVPNVVTPNGDGVNDVFKINALENFPNNKLVVFNRWGKQIYSVTGYKNDWKPEGAAGTYFYVLEVGDGRKYNGFFQLFKD